MFTNFSDIAISNNKGSDYHCIISAISKSEAINLMQNTNLTEKTLFVKKIKIKSNFGAINLLEILI